MALRTATKWRPWDFSCAFVCQEHTGHFRMRSSLVALLCLVSLALAAAEYGRSHEFDFKFGSPKFSSSEESRESHEESNEKKDYRHPSFYTRDVIHGMGPSHSFLTLDFPKPNFPESQFKPNFPQHFEPRQAEQQGSHSSEYRKDDFPPTYDSHRDQYDRVKEEPKPQVSVTKTRDGKKIMTMTKPGYKMVVEEMEEKPDDQTKMVGRTVKENKSSKVKGDNGETMHQSQSYQYQVVQSESSDDKQPARSHVQSGDDLKGIDFSRFSQPQKRDFPSEFPGQYGYQQHQDFVKAHQQNPYGFQVPEAFKDLRIPPGIGRHVGY